MGGSTARFDQPEETKRFPNGEEHIVQVHGVAVGMATFQPGWRWSNDVRPIMGTERCPLLHVGYNLSGRLHVELADGSTLDIGPGEVFEITPDHDAWVVGDEPVVMIDWSGKAREYATAYSAEGSR
jgi:hypothetical protein